MIAIELTKELLIDWGACSDAVAAEKDGFLPVVISSNAFDNLALAEKLLVGNDVVYDALYQLNKWLNGTGGSFWHWEDRVVYTPEDIAAFIALLVAGIEGEE